MSLESDIAVLRNVPLFEDLHADQLRLLAFGAERRRLHRDEFVFREDARSDAGLVIVSGEIALLRGRPERQVVVGTYGPGTLLGEMALITETRRPTSARTLTDCELIRITRPLFRRMLEEYPDYAAGLHAKLKDRLAELTGNILAMEDRFTS